MRRTVLAFAASFAVFAPAVIVAAPTLDQRDPAQARYVAQCYALAGFFAEANATLAGAKGAPAPCIAVVKLRTRSGDLPICAESALQRSPAAAREVASLLARAARSDAAAAAKLLQRAAAIDPFDRDVAVRLSAALRRSGRVKEARAVEARAAELAEGRPVVFAGAEPRARK